MLSLALALSLWAAPAAPTPLAPWAQPSARAPRKVFLTVDEALQLAFGEARTERGTVYLTEAQCARVKELAGEDLHSALVHPYVARDAEGAVLGTAYFDTHRVRTLEECLMVVVAADGKVRRVELCSFDEPPEYVPRGSWYGQFLGHALDDELQLKRGIRGVTGATLTARATTSAVRRVLALDAVIGPGAKHAGAPPR